MELMSDILQGIAYFNLTQYNDAIPAWQKTKNDNCGTNIAI